MGAVGGTGGTCRVSVPVNGALVICAGGGIGDSLMASVCARALRTKYARVDALTLAGHRATLEHVPDFDDVLVDEGEVAGVAQMLRERGYGAAVITWATARTADLALRAGIPIRAGQSRRLYSIKFTHRVPVRSERGDVTTHWSQILLDYARAIGCDTADIRPRIVLDERDRTEAAQLLERNGAPAAFAIVHPTSAVSPTRPVWPLEGWIELVRALQARYDLPIFITGTIADAAIAQSLAGATGAVSIAGATAIGGFAALAQRATFYVGMSSGAMHVAAAAGAVTAGIFAMQDDVPDRWAPLGERVAVVRASYACHPGDRKETCPDYACIRHLAVPRVLAGLDGLLHPLGERV